MICRLYYVINSFVAVNETMCTSSLRVADSNNAVAAEQEETIEITPGIYIVKIGNCAEKVIVK